MRTRRLGRSDVALSTMGFGAWVTGTDTFASSLDEPALRRAIRTALDAGVNWIDTAELYAGGLSEQIVGRALADASPDVLVATKVAPSGAGTGLRPDEVRGAIRGSLRRLGRDHVDLYLLHWHDPGVSLEETWGTMQGLVEEGLARCIGVCNSPRAMVERCRRVAPVAAVQNQFSLLHRDDGASLLEWLHRHDVAYLAYGSLAFGLLSGRIDGDTRFGDADWRSGRTRWEGNYYEELFAPGRLEAHVRFVRGLSATAARMGRSPSELALGWVLAQPGVTALVMGSGRPRHIRSNARAAGEPLDRTVLDQIDALLARSHANGDRVGEAAP